MSNDAWATDIGSIAKLRFYARDVANVVRYGPAAPRAAQLVFVQTDHIRTAICETKSISRWESGRVVDGDWDAGCGSVLELPKISMVIERIRTGMAWETLGAIEAMESHIANKPGTDGCFSMEDARQRYDRIDRLIEQVASLAEPALKTRQELHPNSFREFGGIYVHFDRFGEPVFGHGGNHRLAIAIGLKIRRVPIQVGIVHRDAIRGGAWPRAYEE